MDCVMPSMVDLISVMAKTIGYDANLRHDNNYLTVGMSSDGNPILTNYAVIGSELFVLSTVEVERLQRNPWSSIASTLIAFSFTQLKSDDVVHNFLASNPDASHFINHNPPTYHVDTPKSHKKQENDQPRIVTVVSKHGASSKHGSRNQAN